MTLGQLHEIKKLNHQGCVFWTAKKSSFTYWNFCGSETLKWNLRKVLTQLYLQKNLIIKSITKTPRPFHKGFMWCEKAFRKFYNPFDTDDFTADNNKTIAFDEEIVKSVKNISNLRKKNSSKTFWMNGLFKVRVPINDNIFKTISNFLDIRLMAKVIMSETQSWDQWWYPIFTQLINTELKGWWNYLSLRFSELLNQLHLKACNCTVAQCLTWENLQLLQHRLPLPNLVLQLSSIPS